MTKRPDVSVFPVNPLLTDVTPTFKKSAGYCILRHSDENRNPVLSGVLDTYFRRYDGDGVTSVIKIWLAELLEMLAANKALQRTVL